MALVYVLLLAMLIIVLCLTLDIVSFAKNRKNGTTEPDVSVLNSSLFNKTKQTLMIFAYPLLPLGFLFAINHLNFTLSFVGIVLAFAVSMLTDTCAYLIGRACGKNKFIPEVSPNKTVEGVVGGFIGGIVGAILCFVIFYFANIFDFASINVLWKLILSFAIVGILGSYINQLGDLVASAFKRKVGIKDFSNIFPGHGGFMDRVDGLMFTMTFTFIIFVLVLV
jgi:phosphatidate cytidylyltransferase